MPTSDTGDGASPTSAVSGGDDLDAALARLDHAVDELPDNVEAAAAGKPKGHGKRKSKKKSKAKAKVIASASIIMV
jgi:hypothetical protein